MTRRNLMKIAIFTVSVEFFVAAYDLSALGNINRGRFLTYTWHPVFIGRHDAQAEKKSNIREAIIEKRYIHPVIGLDQDDSITVTKPHSYYLPKDYYLRLIKRGDEEQTETSNEGPKLSNFVAAYLTPVFRRNGATEKRNMRGVQRTMILLG